MIGNSIMYIGYSLLKAMFGVIEFFALPLDAVLVLANIVKYGAWVVGLDMLLLCAGLVAFWWSLRFAVGVVLFIWRLLPLT